ncbi:ATP-binding protein [Streptomyces sp. CAU 1734]|uniref:ATP-binding protein n=1 Tax=Streptomyces sp. CAU 1734 TaxID=3140360 RepID=UPI0032602AF7
MPIAVSAPHAGTICHSGRLVSGCPDTVEGFAASLHRSRPPGDPLTERELSWPCRMRRLARTQLLWWDVEELTETVDVLVSELVTNAVQHGHGTTVTTRLSRTATYLCVEVVTGAGGPGRPCPRIAGPEDEGGRGLFLVNALSDTWGVSSDGTLTWCVLATSAGDGR